MRLSRKPLFASRSRCPHAPVAARSLTLPFWKTALACMGTVLVAGALQGCKSDAAQAADAPTAPQVDVRIVATGQVKDWTTFTGHFEAVESVELRPRVSGYIDDVRFDEGSDVSQGEVLFVIDQRPYQLQLERAQAEVERARSLRELAQIDLDRSEKLISLKAVSKEEYDQRASKLSQAEAELQAAQAALEQAQLNLEYTYVVSPIAGRVSRAEVTRGNYVTAGSSVLTTLVSLDPIYVSFNADEHSFNNLKGLIHDGTLPSAGSGELPVHVGLTSDGDFPYTGQLTFIDNRVNRDTGTIASRALISNPDGEFTPGMAARVRLQGSGSYQAALVDDAAIATDQDRKYVLVVNDKGVVEYRRVYTGSLYEGRRIVQDGLDGGERIVVHGLQRIRPGMTVQPNVIEAAAPDAAKLAFRF
ncbi:efflux RND transporter periplasmic adaptor subunit [Haliea sp. E17]|uniref:efflux RND transporter periplasmic adaptor subunit n=1 Tax=Haliea sp. E17 TaxID=3401576 RepID=UPI003AAE07AF